LLNVKIGLDRFIANTSYIHIREKGSMPNIGKFFTGNGN